MINFLLFLNEKFNYKIKIIAITKNPKFLKKKFFFEINNLKILKADITKKKIEHSFKSDFFFHFASPVDPKKYTKYPKKTFLDIINSTNTVIDYLKKNKNTKLIFSSSSEIYVKKINNVINFEANQSYALGKKISEIMFLNMSKNSQKVINLRLFNFFSPLENLKNSRVIPNMIYQCIKNGNLKIQSDGLGIRYFAYVKDVIIYILLLLNKKIKKNIIDVGNPKNKISIKELGEMILKLNNISKKKLIIRNLYKDAKGVKPNINILKLKGYKPEVNFKKELKRVFFFHKENYK